MPTYLLRLNLDIKERNFKDQLRFKMAVASIKSLSKKNNKVVILSHFARPKGVDKKLSLRPFAKALTLASGKSIRFIPHFDFKRIKAKFKLLPAEVFFF